MTEYRVRKLLDGIIKKLHQLCTATPGILFIWEIEYFKCLSHFRNNEDFSSLNPKGFLTNITFKVL